MLGSRPADEASSASQQHLHRRTLWRACGSATSKQQPVSVLRTAISPWWDSTTPRAMARPSPAPPSVELVRDYPASRCRRPDPDKPPECRRSRPSPKPVPSRPLHGRLRPHDLVRLGMPDGVANQVAEGTAEVLVPPEHGQVVMIGDVPPRVGPVPSERWLRPPRRHRRPARTVPPG